MRRKIPGTRTILARIPMFIESFVIVQVRVNESTTASDLCRQLGVYPPSALYKWPTRIPFKPDENLYLAITKGNSLYIRSVDAQCLDEPKSEEPTHETR